MRMDALSILAVMGLAVASVAQSQSAAEGSARGRSNAAVTNGARSGAVSQASEGAGSARAGQRPLAFEGGTELDAELTHGVDARRAKPGDEVRAELTESARSSGGVVLEKGTRLVGQVTKARPYTEASGNSAAATESQLGIVFEKAVIRTQELPIHTTIQALAATEGETRAGSLMVGSDAYSQISGGGFDSASAGGRGGGLIGGASGVVQRSVGDVGSFGGSLEGTADTARRLVDHARSRLVGIARRATRVSGAVHQSGDAVGGLDSAGRFGAGSRGVFGIDGLESAQMVDLSADY